MPFSKGGLKLLSQAVYNKIYTFLLKFVNEKFKKKLPFPIPWELLLVIFSTLTSSLANLDGEGVQIVGEVPQGQVVLQNHFYEFS